MAIELMGTKSKRRDKLVIMTEIVEIAKKSTSKTHIMFKANLSFAQLNEYIGFLLKHNLLSTSKNEGKTVYKSTEKGLDFMERQLQIIGMINDNYYKSVIISPINRSGLLRSKPFICSV